MSKLILVDPHLKDFAHHHYNYTTAIVRAARDCGIETRVLICKAANDEVVSALEAEPLLSALAYQPLQLKLLNTLKIGPTFQYLYAIARRFFELRRHLSPAVTSDTIVLVPTCDARNLMAWILWCACQSANSTPVILLTLRFPCVRTDRDAVSGLVRAAYALALKCLPRLDAAERIKLCTDSHLLAMQYGDLSSRPISILPIPHTEGNSGKDAFGEQPRNHSHSISTIVALGDARMEKGFDVLVDAIVQLSTTSLEQELSFKVHCPVHVTHMEMAQHVDRLHALEWDKLGLIREFLSEQEYFSLLNMADIVVMPYRQESYACRTSGPLIEAMTAGKIVVGTEQTWLSEKISEYGGGVTFHDGDADSLSAAIITAHRNRAALLEKACIGAQRVRSENNPEHFLNCVANIAMAIVSTSEKS